MKYSESGMLTEEFTSIKSLIKNDSKLGIVDLRNIDPLKIKKVRNVEKEKDPKTKIDRIKKVEEFYVFNDKGFDKTLQQKGQQSKLHLRQ